MSSVVQFTSFQGMIPGVDEASVPEGFAAYAKDMFFSRGDALYPEESPTKVSNNLVNPDGSPFRGIARTLWKCGGFFVAWDYVHKPVLDPRRWGGPDAFLFVQGGRIFRTCSAWIKEGKAPVSLGIERPSDAPKIMSTTGDPNIWTVKPFGFPTNSDTPDVPEGCDTPQQPGEVRSYIVCFVNDMDEESAPGEPMPPTRINPETAVSVVYEGGIPRGVVKYRWYRTLAAGSPSGFRFVKETTEPLLYDIYDTLMLGDDMETEEHYPLPEGVKGIQRFGNESIVAWTDYEFFVSHQRLPHAFAPKNRYTLPYRIIHGQHVLSESSAQPVGHDGQESTYETYFLTERHPFWLSGSIESRVLMEIEVDEPLLHPALSCHGEGIVYYISKRGLIALQRSEVIDESSKWSADRRMNWWGELGLDKASLGYYQGRLFLLGESRSWTITPTSYIKDRVDTICESSVTATALMQHSPLYFVQEGGVYEWGGGPYMNAVWRSGTMRGTQYYCPGAIKAERRHIPHPTNNPQPDRAVKATVYRDNTVWAQKNLPDDLPRRLPRQGKSLYWTYEIQTNIVIRRFSVGKSVTDFVKESD